MIQSLKSIQVQNYRSMQDIDLDITPLTLLIGANASGKSNILDVFTLLSAGVKGNLKDAVLRRHGPSGLLYRGTEDRRIRLSLTFAARSDLESMETSVPYRIELSVSDSWFSVSQEEICTISANGCMQSVLNRSGENYSLLNKNTYQLIKSSDRDIDTELLTHQTFDRESYPAIFGIRKWMEGLSFYGPVPTDPNSEIRVPQYARSGTRLYSDGSNLVSVLHEIKEKYSDTWKDIHSIIHLACPVFRDIIVPPEGGDGKIAMRWLEEPFHERGGFSANLLSDGTLRFLFLVTLLMAPDPPPLICIDEPEAGLHPDCIGIIAELLDRASYRTQIIVSTHSPELVSNTKPESVVVVEKENGATVAERLDANALKDWLRDFRLGDLWLSGDIGGRA